MQIILYFLYFELLALLFSQYLVFLFHFFNLFLGKIALILESFLALLENPEVLVLHFLDQDFMLLQVLVTAFPPLLRAGTLQTDNSVSLFMGQNVELFAALYELFFDLLSLRQHRLLVD